LRYSASLPSRSGAEISRVKVHPKTTTADEQHLLGKLDLPVDVIMNVRFDNLSRRMAQKSQLLGQII
jgi:hypothetical protein